MAISWPAGVEATSMIPFAMTLHYQLQLTKTQMPLVTRKVQFHSNFFVLSVQLAHHKTFRNKGCKNVFHKDKYRCREGAPDQVAA